MLSFLIITHLKVYVERAVSSLETLLSSFRKIAARSYPTSAQRVGPKNEEKIDEPGTFVRINKDKKDKKKPGQTVPSISVYVTPRTITDSFNDAPRDVDNSESIAINLVS